MAKGISIPMAFETRDAEADIKNGVQKPLSEVVDELDKVAKAGTDSGGDLEEALRKQQGAAATTKTSYSDLKDGIIKSEGEGTTAVGLNAGQRVKLSKTAIKQLGANAKASLGGDVASMASSAEGAVSSIGTSVSGILATFGPVGAGIATAVGLATGLIAGQMTKTSAATKKLKADASALGKEYIKTGQMGVTGLDYVANKLEDLATTTEESGVKITQLQKIAELTGVPFKELTDIYLSNDDAARGLLQTVEDQIKAYEAYQTSAGDAAVAGDAEAGKRYDGNKRLATILKDQIEIADAAATAQELYAKAGGKELVAKAEHLKSINAYYDEGAGNITDFLKKETGIFDTTAYLSAMKRRERAIQDYNNTIATVGLTPEAKAYIEKQGVEAAAAMLAGYKGETEANQAELDRIWSEAGKENSAQYVNSIQDTLKGKSITPPKVGPLDFSDADAQIDRWVNKKRKDLTASVRVVERSGTANP